MSPVAAPSGGPSQRPVEARRTRHLPLVGAAVARSRRRQSWVEKMSRTSSASPSSPWLSGAVVRPTCKKRENGNFRREFVKCESRPQEGKVLRQCTFFMWMDAYVEKLQVDGFLQGCEMGRAREMGERKEEVKKGLSVKKIGEHGHDGIGVTLPRTRGTGRSLKGEWAASPIRALSRNGEGAASPIRALSNGERAASRRC
ncbi:hypothetical protein BRADI_1g35573v3 [Brachypodium distachyon]|uniref:Zinc finger GRF-type domain-containing protein n=1 Tax=Brachypodium distachyon TaxID=15368 RepID=A0A2K2DMU7_BRADI|nr:hypothetical protein BRADI_1g35573v3 [Brachypodium distachyon]